LHRLRHSVATFLAARGQILQAQARLGHRDAAPTLRDYSYALPLTDRNVADAIDAHLDQPVTTETALEPHDASDASICTETPCSIWLIGGAPNRIFCCSLFLANPRRRR